MLNKFPRSSQFPSTCIALLALLLFAVTLAKPYNNSPPIRSDGSGYHIWVHAIKQRTINFCDHRKLLEPIGALSMVNEKEQKCGNKYPPGVGIIQAPLTIAFAQANTSKGFTNAEHWLILGLGSILLLATAFISGKTLQSLNCNHSAIILSTAATIFGTGLFHYATYDGSFSHIYSSFLFSGTLLIAAKPQQEANFFGKYNISVYSILCLLLILVRQTNLLLILGSSFILASNQSITAREKIKFAAYSMVAILSGIGFYFAYNFFHLGYFTLSTYGGESVVPFAQHTLGVFLSYERGLFTYYPIFALAIGIGWVASAVRSIYLTTIGLVVSYGLVYGSWSSWYLGGGFGHRGFVDMAPIIILVLGASFEQIKTRKNHNFWITLTATIAIIFIYITASTQFAYWNSNYPFEGATQMLYWRTLMPIIP